MVKTINGFYNKWNNVLIDDWGCYMSDEAKAFFRDMKTALNAELMERDINSIEFSVNHYDCSGFCEKDGKYIYFSYNITRNLPNDLNQSNALRGFLFRMAEHEKDFHGGNNHFCSWKQLPDSIAYLFECNGVWNTFEARRRGIH